MEIMLCMHAKLTRVFQTDSSHDTMGRDTPMEFDHTV